MSCRSILLVASVFAAGNGALAFTPAARPCTSSSSSTSSLMATSDRRNFINNFSIAAAGAMLVGINTNAANALDFDAFEKGIVDNDTAKCDPKRDPKCIPKLSDDQALCKYGAGGNARGEACARVKKAGGKLPEIKKEKSLGGAYAM